MPAIGWAETHLVPLLTASERYDSNVFFASKRNLAAANLQGEDWVTNISPQLLMLHRGTYVTGSLQVGASSEVYARNSGLNYVGYNGTLSMNLTDTVRRVDPRAGLWISGSAFYTPTPPAFIGASAESQAVNPIVRGIQASRVNTLGYTAGAGGTYTISPTTNLQSAYYYSSVQFGTAALKGPGAQVFDTVSQVVTGGVTKKATPKDSISFNYTYQLAAQATGEDFKTHGLTATWSRTISREWFSTVAGGATTIETLRDPSTGSTLVRFGDIFPNGTVSLSYRTVTQRLFGEGSTAATPMFGNMSGTPILPGSSVPGLSGSVGIPGSTAFSVYYSVGVYPSYAVAAGPSLSHVVGANAAYGLTERMSVVGGANYSRNEQAGQRQLFSFYSYSTTAGLSFLLSQNFRGSLLHNFSDFRQSAGTADSSFRRQIVMLSITYIFGSGFNAPTAFFADPAGGEGFQPANSGVDKR